MGGKAILAVLVLLCLTPRAGAALEWQQTQFDYTATAEDDSVSANFSFRNTGDYPVTIQEVHSDCGCTVAKTERSVYLPGEEGKVLSTFTFGQRMGRQMKNIRIRMDDPQNPTVTLTMSVDIPRLMKFTPSVLVWEAGQFGKTQWINAVKEGPLPVKVVSARSTDARMLVVVETLEEGQHYHIGVTPTNTRQPLSAVINVVTDAPGQDRKEFRLFATVK